MAVSELIYGGTKFQPDGQFNSSPQQKRMNDGIFQLLVFKQIAKQEGV